MMGANRVVIAAAGSGKTTFLVNEALKVKDEGVLITTYTESNEAEIKQRIFEIYGHIPPNIVVMSWWSFLISHGVKPFQGRLFDFSVRRLQLVSQKSGFRAKNKADHPIYWGEDAFEHHYFDSSHQVYSDKLAKLVIRCNKASKGDVIDRISRVFQHIFVDEVQDLAGYDLDILALFFASASRVILVGDPRQVTYLTHNEARHSHYADGRLLAFLKEKLRKRIVFDIDEDRLNTSHRNNDLICALSSRLYPALKATTACKCRTCRPDNIADQGLFFVHPKDKERYMRSYQPMQLCWAANSSGVDRSQPAMTFGGSKGLGFDRVLIYPTTDMLSWLHDNRGELKPQTRARMYVALTRAKHSVAIIAEAEEGNIPACFTLYT
jgi:DNA helicase II / ATP-dependent DNA helicase PcrA